jgi:hypothetical protein
MGSKTDLFENKLTDFLWRGQQLTMGGVTATWSEAPTFYIGLFKVAPTDSTPGTEVSGGSYARRPIVASLASMSGTQGAGTTEASTGVNATTSNNAVIAFTNMPDTTSANALVGFGIFGSLTGNDLLEYAPLIGAPISASAGATLSFAAGALQIQEDN